MIFLKVFAVLLVFVFLISGCAVSTKTIGKDEILARIALDRDSMYKEQEPLTSQVTLEDAMAWSIKYNLDHRLKIMEQALALGQVELMTFDMLPRLVASSGYSQRDTYNASSSMNVATGQQSLAPSTSSDKGHFSNDLTLVWNILDFGASYYQAKQQSDRSHIMSERRRKVVHSIMQQVRQAYWLALGAQQLQGRFDPLLKEVKAALRDSTRVEQEKLKSPIETLTYRKSLLEILKQLETFRDELLQAKPRLASLMNVPLGQSFTLSKETLDQLELVETLDSMEQKALLQRPELLEADYTERISVIETRKAIVRMLPGIELSVGAHNDNNSFLVNQNWVDGGARVTWNLMNLFSAPGQYRFAKSQVEIAKAQRLALSMAILTQVHVSYQDFVSHKRQYELSEQMQDVDTRIFEQTMNQSQSGSQSRLAEIRAATAALMAEYRSYQNYAALQNTCGQIVATIGEDPLPQTVESHEISALSKSIGTWMRGPSAPCVISKASLKVETPPLVKPVTAEVVTPVPVPAVVVSTPVVPLVAEPVVMVEEKVKNIPMSLPTSAVVIPVSAEPVPPVATTEKRTTTMVISLRFGVGESTLKPQHHAELQTVGTTLKACHDMHAEIGGHTDNQRYMKKGSGNMQLSLLRAESVRNYLVTTFGLEEARLSVKGYGDTMPLASNATEKGKAKNRRIEFKYSCSDR